MSIFDELKVSPTICNKYKLLEDYEVLGVRLPKGYITNGANVPRIFWAIIPPFKPKFLPAILLHDYLCDIEMYKLADIKFEEVLTKIEDSFITKSMVICVKAYHRYEYNI